MKDMIYCKRTDCGFHSFYLVVNGQEYYLFRQNYRKGVQKYYGDGVRCPPRPALSGFQFVLS